MLDDTRTHLQQYGWTGRGRLSREEVRTLFARHNLTYFDKIGDFTDQYEGLRLFTRSVKPELTTKYIEDLPSAPFVRDNANSFITTDLEAMLEYFESYDANPPFACLIGRAICPVGMWRSMQGHGFVIMDTDGMLYITMSIGIWVISESGADFFDRLLHLNELFRINPEKYHAIIDLTLFKD